MKEAMKVLQVCVARTRRVSTAGREAMTAIAKQPVDGPVAFGRLGLQGDEQAHLNVHGGLSKALYACTGEHLLVWQTVPAQARAAPWDEALPPGPREVNIRELFKARARG